MEAKGRTRSPWLELGLPVVSVLKLNLASPTVQRAKLEELSGQERINE